MISLSFTFFHLPCLALKWLRRSPSVNLLRGNNQSCRCQVTHQLGGGGSLSLSYFKPGSQCASYTSLSAHTRCIISLPHTVSSLSVTYINNTKTPYKPATNTLLSLVWKALRTFQGGWINFWVFKRKTLAGWIIASVSYFCSPHTPPTLPHLTRISQIGCDSLALAVEG